MSRRMQFLQWLNRKVFKTPMGQVPNKFLRGIKHILFPLNYFYERQSNIRWDVWQNRYYFGGMEFTARDLVEFKCWLEKRNVLS